MENNRKWVNLSFLAAAFLLGMVVFMLSQKFAVALDFEGRIQNLESYLRIGSLAVGGLFYLILFKNKTSNAYMDEVFTELAKVTWPGREETFKGTIAVLIAVTIAGFMLGMVDWVWSSLMKFLL